MQQARTKDRLLDAAAAVVRREQMQIQTEHGFAVGTAGCQRHM